MQKDLFDTPTRLSHNQAHHKTLIALDQYRLTFRLDQLLAGTIILLLMFVVSFSVGFEKGKQNGFQARNLMNDEQPVKTNSALEGSKAVVSSVDVQPGTHKSEPVEEKRPIAIQEITVSQKDPAGVTVKSLQDGKYTIQIITYTSEKATKRQINRLTQLGHKAFVIPSGQYLQVCVDAFQLQSQAKDVLHQMKAQGLAPQDAYVRPIVR